MNQCRKLFIFIVLVLLLASGVNAGNITSCATVINSSETWFMNDDLNASGNCLQITKNLTTIDCNFHTILGDSSGVGIKYSESQFSTISNCIIDNFNVGVELNNSIAVLTGNSLLNHNIGIKTNDISFVETSFNSLTNNIVNAKNTNPNISVVVTGNWWGTNDTNLINLSLNGSFIFQPFLDYDPYSDQDNDSIPFFSDNCPIYNPNQLDKDNDGIGDLCDNCVIIFNPMQDDTDNDGIGNYCDLDSDGDFICDNGDEFIYNWDNFALNKSVNASSFNTRNASVVHSNETEVTSFIPENAVDSNFSSFWEVNKSGPQSITIDLGEIATVSDILIYYNTNLSSIPNNFTVSFASTLNSSEPIIDVQNNSVTLATENGTFFNLFMLIRPELSRYITLKIYDNLSILPHAMLNNSNSTNESYFVPIVISEIEIMTLNATCIAGPNEVDNCPLISNFEQQDNDIDDVGNLCDNCINSFNPDQDDADFDGKGDACDINLFLHSGTYDPMAESVNISTELLSINEGNFFVIQFYENATEFQIDKLGTRLGVIPEDAFTFESNLSLAQIQASSFVRFANIFHPAYKLGPSLFDEVNSGTINATHTLLIVNVFRNLNSVILDLENLGAIVNADNTTNGRLFVNISAHLIVNISNMEDVSFIEREAPVFLFGDLTPLRINVRPFGSAVNQFTIDDQPVIVSGNIQVIGHIDSGVDLSHTAFSGVPITVTNPQDFNNDILQYGIDADGHGTKTAGVIVGNGNMGLMNNGGLVKGIAYDAELVVHKFTNFIVGGQTPLKFVGRFNRLGQVLDEHYNLGARIHTNSWGTLLSLGRHQVGPANSHAYNNKDSLIVFAAGNQGFYNRLQGGTGVLWSASSYSVFSPTSGAMLGTIASPGIAKNVISIGGTEVGRGTSICGQTYVNPVNSQNYMLRDEFCRQYDNEFQVWGGSSRGPAPDFRLKPEVVAPASGRIVVTSGQQTLSASSLEKDGPSPSSVGLDYQLYTFSSGTSFSTPTVASVAALLRDYLDQIYNMQDPSASLLKAFMINGARDIVDPSNFNALSTEEQYGYGGQVPNFREGYGILDFSDSILPCDDNRCLYFKSEQVDLNEEDVQSYLVRFSKEQPLKATLAWTDPPASFWSSKELMNDLDLVIKSPSGKVYEGGFFNFDERGNSVAMDAPSGVCRSINVDGGALFLNTKLDVNCPRRDDINVNEKIVLLEPEDGFYNITVRATKLRSGPQDFSIVVSGMRGIDTVNGSNNQTSEFPYGDKVYARGVGLPADDVVNVYVVKHDENRQYDNPFPLSGLDVTDRSSLSVSTNSEGQFDTEQLWDTIKKPLATIQSAGKYNVIVDVDGNNKFNPGTDFIDYRDKVGFHINIFEVHMINVGEGESILIKNGPHNFLFDAGSLRSYTANTIPDVIMANDVMQIETFMISHDHDDHKNKLRELDEAGLIDRDNINMIHRKDNTALGGLCSTGLFCVPFSPGRFKFTAVSDFFETPKMGTNPPVLKKLLGEGVKIEAVNDGGEIDFIDFSGVIPGSDPILGVNDRSLGMKFTAGRGPNEISYLMAGDCGGNKWGDCENSVTGKDSMLVVYPDSFNDVSVYKVNHHGSITSSTQEFLDELSIANLAIISADEHGNTAPNPIVLNRLREKDMRICRTYVHGHITLIQNGPDIDVSTQNFGDFCPDAYLTDDSGKPIWEIKSQDMNNPKLRVVVKDINSTDVTIYAIDHEIDTPDGANLATLSSDFIHVGLADNEGTKDWDSLLEKLLMETVSKGSLGYDLVVDYGGSVDGIFNEEVDFRSNRRAIPQEDQRILAAVIPWHLRNPTFKLRTVKSKDAGNVDTHDFSLGQEIRAEVSGIKREVGENVLEEFMITQTQANIQTFLRLQEEHFFGSLRNRIFNVNAVEHGSVSAGGDPISDVTDFVEQYTRFKHLTATDSNSKIWVPSEQTDVGEYDIVVDMRIGDQGPNGIYDPDYDLLLGKPGQPAFTVGCAVGTGYCGSIESAKGHDDEKDSFVNGNTVFATYELQFDESVSRTIYVVRSTGSVFDLQGQKAADMEVFKQVSISLTENKVLDAAQILIDPGSEEFGRFEIFLDADNDQSFDATKDIFDPDGFSIVRDIRQARTDVDKFGNLHVVAIERFFDKDLQRHMDRLLYSKMPESATAVKDLEHPDLHDWSTNFDIADFKILRVAKRLGMPDIAVDKDGGPAIIWEIHIPGFDWLLYKKLNSDGEPDFVYEETSPNANNGDPSDLLYYTMASFEDNRLKNPSIEWDEFNNIPVISSYITTQYPDNFYLTEIYPLVYTRIGVNPYTIGIHPFVPPTHTIQLVAAPVVFWGESIQVARYAFGNRFPDRPPDTDGSRRWPFFYNFDGSQTRFKINDALTQVGRAMNDIALTRPVRDNWHYIVMDEYGQKSFPTFEFFYSAIDVDKNGAIHGVWIGPKDKSDLEDSRLFYGKVNELEFPARELVKDVVVSNIPRPAIAVDEFNVAHILFASEGKLTYYTMDDSNDLEVAKFSSPGLKRFTLDLDSKNNPHIVWSDSTDSGSKLLYLKGEYKSGIVTFPNEAQALELIDISDYTGIPPQFSDPQIVFPTNTEGETWEDIAYVSWLETNDKGKLLKTKRQVPSFVLHLIIDGLSEKMLEDNLDLMPRLKEVLDNNPPTKAGVRPQFPQTTMSSQATMITGLNPAKHGIYGDQFEFLLNKKRYIPDYSPDPNDANNILFINGARNIYEYLKDSDRSSAVIDSLYHRGVTNSRPDSLITPNIVWQSGTIAGFDGHISNYFSDLSNLDDPTNNDVADIATVYILEHDHGSFTKVDNFPYSEIDNTIGSILDDLESENILDNTVIVITSDHGMKAAINDDEHALDNFDSFSINSAITPSKLYLNGKVAYNYEVGDYETEIKPLADHYYNNSFVWADSEFFGRIEKVIVKKEGIYYNYLGNGLIIVSSDESVVNLNGPESPTIILFTKGDNYFGNSHDSIIDQDAKTLFYVTGPGYKSYSVGANTFVTEIDQADVAPSIAYLVGGPRLVNTMSGLDGENVLDNSFTASVGSPVNLHVYDNESKHTGINVFGAIEELIPTSDYSESKISTAKKIAVKQVISPYRVEVEGYAPGTFKLSLIKDTKIERFEINYPQISVKADSLAVVDMINEDFSLQYDFDGDGKFETTIPPDDTILIVQEEDLANATILFWSANSTFEIDTKESTSSIISAYTPLSVSSKVINIQKTNDISLDGPGFFTAGYFIDLTIDDLFNSSLINSTLSIKYPENLILKNNLAEKGLKIFKRNDANTSWGQLPTVLDVINNVATVPFVGSGRYIVASDDLGPVLSNLVITPRVTINTADNISVSVDVIDNNGVSSVSAEILENVTQLINTNGSNWQGTVIGPIANATEIITIKATDNNNNSKLITGFVQLDKTPPNIDILSPQSIIYTVNNISLDFFVDEESNQSYEIDLVPFQVNNTEPFTLVNVPLILASGNHALSVKATDTLGNSRVTQPVQFEIAQQNIEVVSIGAKPFYRSGEIVNITGTIKNTLITAETNIQINFKEDGIVKSTKFINLSGLEQKPLTFSYLTSNGRHDLEIEAVQLPFEPIISDNKKTKVTFTTDKIPILFVEDDNSTDYANIINLIELSDTSKYSVLYWDSYIEGEVTQELLNSFSGIFWFSDDKKSTSVNELVYLKNYVEQGGNLLISSNNLAGEIESSGVLNLMGISFVSNISGTTQEGLLGDIIGSGLLFSISNPGDTVNPKGAPSNANASIFPQSGGSSAIKSAGLISAREYKTIYYSFNLNNINEQDALRKIIDRSLNYFNIDIEPPFILVLEPKISNLIINTTNVTINLLTDEQADCSYIDIRYGPSPINFSNTSKFEHTTTITNLTNGIVYNFLLLCQDTRLNVNSNTTINFFIHNRTFTPPVLENIADISDLENNTIKIKPIATDSENDPITFSIKDKESYRFTPIAGRFNFVIDEFILGTNFDDAGNYSLIIIANDSYSTDEAEFNLNIENVNRKPVITSFTNQLAIEDQFFELNINANDPDGDSIQFFDNTPLFKINQFLGSITFTPKNEVVGVHSITIAATDGNLTDQFNFQLTVQNTNDAPTVDFISPQVAAINAFFNYSINASDPDNDTLFYFDNSSVFNISTSGLISFTPTISDFGLYDFIIKVGDGIINASRILNLLIDQQQTIPIVDPIPNLVVNINDTFTINVSACDPDFEVCS